MDETPADYYLLRVPAGTMVDGAVTELQPRRPPHHHRRDPHPRPRGAVTMVRYTVPRTAHCESGA
jgi:hypothetical protein